MWDSLSTNVNHTLFNLFHHVSIYLEGVGQILKGGVTGPGRYGKSLLGGADTSCRSELLRLEALQPDMAQQDLGRDLSRSLPRHFGPEHWQE